MDLHTLHVEHAVLLALYSFLAFVNSRLHRGMRGVLAFPVYNICAMVGAILIALRGTISDPVSIVGGTVFFAIAYLFLHWSLTEFFGRPNWGLRTQAALVVLAFATSTWFGAVHPDTTKRLICYSFILALQTGFSAFFVFRNARSHLRISGDLMGVVLALLCLNNLIRELGTILSPAPANYLRGGALYSWGLLEISVLQGAISIAFVWMTAATLRRDLELQASTDSLTGVLNRRALEKAASRAIAVSLRTQSPLCAILLDLDRFKQINDTFGHQCGDAALVTAAYAFRSALPPGGLLARIGGDEFLVLLPGCGLADATVVAEEVRETLTESTFSCIDASIRLDVSCGVAQLHGPATTWDQLLLLCDKALYAEKHLRHPWGPDRRKPVEQETSPEDEEYSLQ